MRRQITGGGNGGQVSKVMGIIRARSLGLTKQEKRYISIIGQAAEQWTEAHSIGLGGIHINKVY